MRCVLWRASAASAKALLDDLLPGGDEDVQDLALARPYAGGVDQHQMPQRALAHDRHVRGDPAADADADQRRPAPARPFCRNQL